MRKYKRILLIAKSLIEGVNTNNLIKDINDAIEYLKDVSGIRSNINQNEFNIAIKSMSLSDIQKYEDISGWIEWEKGELLDYTPTELQDELSKFRGSYATKWINNKWPPIIIVDSEKYGFTGLADGRGRFSIAYGLNTPKIPVAILTDNKEAPKNKLIQATEQWYDLPLGNTLDDLIWALYELEFKYSQLKSNPDKWTGTPERYDNTLSKMGKMLLGISKEICKKLSTVYKNWLSEHAIAKPKTWAKARLKSYEMDGDINEALSGLAYEYRRYADGSNLNRKLSESVSKNLNQFPELKSILEEIGEAEIEALNEDADSYEENELEERIKYYEDIENVWDDISTNYDIIDDLFSVFNIPEKTIKKLIVFWSEHVIFPVWFEHWKKEGIENTRKTIETIYKEIVSVTNNSISDPQKAASITNKALQASHQTGSMMEYIESQYDVSFDLLEHLSNLDTSHWEKELKEIGLKTAADQIQYPKAETTIEGLKIRKEIPNMSSISASLNEYEILPEIRKIPISEFGGPNSVFYAADDFRRSKNLAEEIQNSKEINPLIIVIDEEGPYILEGAHRFVALYYLNKKSIPALVVLDKDEELKFASKNKALQYLADYTKKKIKIAEESNLPTLDEFLNNNMKNSYIDVKGFNNFYARKGPYYINGKVLPKVFQIANIEATKKGQGAFSNLIEKLKDIGNPILVECILNPRLSGKLEKLGFKQVNKNTGTHYLWEPNIKMSAKNNEIKFVRYGGLSSVKQKGYNTNMPTFHSPPARRGFYAFVWPYIEYFLLGKGSLDQRRMKWKKDSKGNKITIDNEEESGMFLWKNEEAREEFERMLDEDVDSEILEKFRLKNMYQAEHKKPKTFTYKDELWHHLDVPHRSIIQHKGDWVKTSFDDYKKALFKEIGRMDQHKKREGIGYSYDHLEVFIEKIN